MKKTTLSFLFLNLFMLLSVSTFATELSLNGEIDGSIPSGWTYIPSDVAYPNPSFYKQPKGLKMNFEGQGILSPEFAAQSSVDVTLVVGALNPMEKESSSDQFFTITGLNADEEQVAVAYLTSVEVGDNVVTLSGQGIVRVKVIMTGYPNNGSSNCNVNLAGVKIDGSDVTAVIPTVENKFDAYVAQSTLYVNGMADGAQVEIYSLLGARVLVATLENGSVALYDLSKGIYVVRTGNYSKKIVM